MVGVGVNEDLAIKKRRMKKKAYFGEPAQSLSSVRSHVRNSCATDQWPFFIVVESIVTVK